jgi:hypothetical protein
LIWYPAAARPIAPQSYLDKLPQCRAGTFLSKSHPRNQPKITDTPEL